MIRHAQILLPGGEFLLREMEVRDRQITRIAPDLSLELSTGERSPVQEIDALGLSLLPGVLDPQVHFREPGLEHREYLFAASCACAKGGVTSCLEMPNTRPLTTT
nr:hypothetical protein [Oculatella sp. FACHB-28]